MNDFAKADFVSERSREHKSIEGQYQLVVLAQFVGEDKTNRDEFWQLFLAFSGHALQRVNFGFQN
ncbi:MAG: hypothetical protein WA869_14170, partial [Alloacidobacterium sp.]